MSADVLVRRMMLADFIGIPYVERGRKHEGADCWGICMLAARELWAMDLPEYFYPEGQILEHACELIGREIKGPHWRALGVGEGPCPIGSIHIFRIRGFEVHCGLDLGKGTFLHSLPGRNSCIEFLNDINWIQRRVGTYQWTP